MWCLTDADLRYGFFEARSGRASMVKRKVDLRSQTVTLYNTPIEV